jgi:hypothetical protein
MHGGGNVLYFLGADIGELHRQLVGDLFVDRARDTDAADFGETFQPRRDVDAVAQQITVALHHIADGDADAEGHLPAGRIGHIPRAQAFLDIDRAAYGFNRARKFGEHRIPGRIENAAAALGDEIIGHQAIGREPPQRFLLVLRYQSAVAGNIGRKNRRDLAFHENSPGQISAPEQCRQTFPDATMRFRARFGRQNHARIKKRPPPV